jgi:hypothetical protein
MTRVATLLGLLLPASAWADEGPCTTFLVDYWHYHDVPASGDCTETTYFVAEAHCAEVGYGVYTAYEWKNYGKAVGWESHDLECWDGYVLWFEW